MPRLEIHGGDTCCTDAILALGLHEGLPHEDLVKAIEARDASSFDPRFPELVPLVRRAQRDWRRYGEALVKSVLKLARAGRLFPMTAAIEEELRAIFAVHRLGFVAGFSGYTEAPSRWAEIVAADPEWFPDPTRPEDGLIGLGWKLGRQVDAVTPRRWTKAELQAAAPELPEMVKRAATLRLDPAEIAALRYAQRSAALYMRRPAESLGDEVIRVLYQDERREVPRGRALSKEEQRDVAEQVQRAVAGRQAWKPLARNLREGVLHPSLTNDMDRVARTELVFAHNDGARVALRAQCHAAGIQEPKVFKMVRPGACRSCIRIWGPPGKPRIYTLAEVEANDRDGGNFRRKEPQWRAVTGPVHPNCTEGPLMLSTPELHEALRDTMALYSR